uniref:hypothetical protein n=1 Tax=Periconia digitata TaxID=1303443 RepID=UPI0023AB0014|nr:hypothetical protein P1Q94_mgp07 [Periconia digitata]WCA44853.1 hypothetical protein [Periconia digitata]
MVLNDSILVGDKFSFEKSITKIKKLINSLKNVDLVTLIFFFVIVLLWLVLLNFTSNIIGLTYKNDSIPQLVFSICTRMALGVFLFKLALAFILGLKKNSVENRVTIWKHG